MKGTIVIVMLASVALFCDPAVAGLQTFTDYGKGQSVQLSAAGGQWEQTWGHDAWAWYTAGSGQVRLLDKNVEGLLATTATGQPVIDAQLVLHLPIAGQLTLTAYDQGDPQQEIGSIIGSFSGTFIGDINASHAFIDEDAGIIQARFGVPVGTGPDGWINVTSTTGIFQDIVAVGSWEWHVSGVMTLARVPGLDVQTNIMAALQNSALILGAEEEVVLTGQFVPEPTTLVLLGLGALLAARRAKR